MATGCCHITPWSLESSGGEQMKDYNSSDLEQLVSCAKTFIDPPRREMREDGPHLRNDARLESAGIDGTFYMFLRVNAEFRENFSIGLDYQPAEGGRLTLLRFNGPHGPFNEMDNEHFQFHIHRATPESIQQTQASRLPAEATGVYASYEEALRHFLEVTGVQDWRRHFPGIAHLPLFEGI
jgi:hypothetical protein